MKSIQTGRRGRISRHMHAASCHAVVTSWGKSVLFIQFTIICDVVVVNFLPFCSFDGHVWTCFFINKNGSVYLIMISLDSRSLVEFHELTFILHLFSFLNLRPYALKVQSSYV